MPKHLSVTQASVTGVFVYIVGQVVAFVPSLSNAQQQLISVGSLVIAVAFLAVHLVQDYKTSKAKVALTDLEPGIRGLAQDEIGKVPYQQIAQDVVAANGLSDPHTLVKNELSKILVQSGVDAQRASGGVSEPPMVPVPMAPTPPVETAQQIVSQVAQSIPAA